MKLDKNTRIYIDPENGLLRIHLDLTGDTPKEHDLLKRIFGEPRLVTIYPKNEGENLGAAILIDLAEPQLQPIGNDQPGLVDLGMVSEPDPNAQSQAEQPNESPDSAKTNSSGSPISPIETSGEDTQTHEPETASEGVMD